MPFVPAENVAQLEFRYTCDGVFIENVLYFKRSQAIDSASLQVLTGAAATWFNTYIRTNMHQAVVHREIYARDLTTEQGITYTNITYAGTPGQNTQSRVPSNVTLCLSFRTGLAGRSRRGRNYTLPVEIAKISANSFTSAYVTALTAAYQRWLPGGGSIPAGWTWVVISRWSNGSLRDEALVTPVTAVVAVNNYADSQRRRLPGR